MTDRPFYTRYPEGENRGQASSYVFASSAAHAEQLVEQRGLGETIQRDKIPELPSVLVRRAFAARLQRNRDSAAQGRPPQPDESMDAIHSLVFLVFVALRSGTMHESEVTDRMFSDTGLLHEAIHLLATPVDQENGMPIASVLAEIERLERLVPGFLPKEDRR